jgi:hypothetical protein
MKKLLKADSAPSCIDIDFSALKWRKKLPLIDLGLADYPPLLSHILNGNEYRPLLNGPDVARHRDEWRTFIRDMASCVPTNAVLLDRFHTQWHVGHHHIRALVDDDDLLMDMLWKWLPRYNGSELLLYRGENLDRFELGRIGTAWSDKESVAKMFASGLNAEGRGGVILETTGAANSIIAGPSAHSIYLQEYEYTIDTRRLSTISVKCHFSPRHC